MLYKMICFKLRKKMDYMKQTIIQFIKGIASVLNLLALPVVVFAKGYTYGFPNNVNYTKNVETQN